MAALLYDPPTEEATPENIAARAAHERLVRWLGGAVTVAGGLLAGYLGVSWWRSRPGEQYGPVDEEHYGPHQQVSGARRRRRRRRS